jgi:hypothetical protein
VSDEPCSQCEEMEAELLGLLATTRSQAKQIGRLEREVKRLDDAEVHHPQRKEIVRIVEVWREVTNHPNAKVSRDRIELVKARLKDGYNLDQIELAVRGLGANPYVVNAKRSPTGKPSQRYDQMKHALSGGEKLEALANLGAQIAKEN